MTLVIEINCQDCFNYDNGRIEVEEEELVQILQNTDTKEDAAVQCLPDVPVPEAVSIFTSVLYFLDKLGAKVVLDMASEKIRDEIEKKIEDYQGQKHSAELVCDNCNNTLTEEDIEVRQK